MTKKLHKLIILTGVYFRKVSSYKLIDILIQLKISTFKIKNIENIT